MAKQDFDVSDYAEENQPLALRVLRKRYDNVKRVARLEQQGADLDVTVARVEHFMKYLVKIGVLSETQLLEGCLEWEEGMASQLAMIEDRVAMRREQFKQEQERAAREAMLQAGQGQGGIVLPNGQVVRPKSATAPQPEKQPDE